MEILVTDLFTKDVLLESARRFAINPDSLKPISDVENFVYYGQAGNAPLILRITHSSHRSVDLIAGELDWINRLTTQGMSVTQPVCSINGSWIEVVEGKDTQFLVTAFDKLEGATILDANVCTPVIYQLWGETLGKMHRLAKSYVPTEESFKRREWFQNDLVSKAEKYIPGQISILEKYHQLIDALHKLPTTNDSYGLIHTDFTDVNFFVHEGQISVFDFDDCEYHWFIYDIALILFETLPWLPHLGMDKEAFARFFFSHFITGYEKENYLDDFWLNQLPNFFKLREMFLYVVFHKRWDFEHLNDWQTRTVHEYKFNIDNDIPYLDVVALFINKKY